MVTLCSNSDLKEQIEVYADQLKAAAPFIGNHGMQEDAFWESGLFDAAIERLRGSHAATMAKKKTFIAMVLDYLKTEKKIREWIFSGSDERHDYEVILLDGTKVVIEAKGCLDGNNTNIFQRPLNADEFYIWSLCQNAGSNPAHNAWSGIHTRLSAEIIHRRQQVDALILWDMLCGAKNRPCPKLSRKDYKPIQIDGQILPPPCLYLFPKTIPDARNNKAPSSYTLEKLSFASLLIDTFGGNAVDDTTVVKIEARMNGDNTERKTSLLRGGHEIYSSSWTKIKRAR